MKSYNIEGILWLETESGFNELLKYQLDKDSSESGGVAVIAFAQRDMVQRFMNGVDMKYVHASSSFLESICDDFVDKVVKNLDKYNTEEKEEINDKLNRAPFQARRDKRDEQPLTKPTADFGY